MESRKTVFNAHVSGYSRRRSACCRMGRQPGEYWLRSVAAARVEWLPVHRQPVGRTNPAMSFSAVSQ
jgi:hypothetical protein